MTATIGLIALFVLLLVGMPVGFALLLSGLLGLYLIGGEGLTSAYLASTPLASVSSFELITVPMFILMAEFVVRSGVATDLFRAATIWVGRIRGGLAVATALAGAGFGAICGSSTASAATLASTSVPAMLERGYEPRLVGGVVAISGTLAMLIPPSIALVLYAVIADANIGALLIAGIIPGLMITATIIITVYLLILKNPAAAPAGQSYPFVEKLRSIKVLGPMALLFFCVTGVIYAGVATPSEAAAIGAIGAFAIAVAARRMSMAILIDSLRGATTTTCIIYIIIVGAHVFGYFFTMTQATQSLVAFVTDSGLPNWLLIGFILLLYLILGCFLDQIAILVLTVPILLPVVVGLGHDPIWFGVIVVVMAEIGLVTPPLGLNVFVVSKYSGRPVGEVFAGIGPHVVTHLIAVILMCIFPQIVLWLPSMMR